MRVEFEIRFEQKELEAMCLEKCKDIATPIPGHFEASSGYGMPAVTVTFIPDPTREEQKAAAAEADKELLG